MDPTAIDQTTAELVDAWQGALKAVADLAEGVTAAEWGLPSPCPGWTVGDVVAHVTDIEDFLSGAPRPDHTPDFDALPHAQGFVGQLTETGVDFRRGRAPAEVVAELSDGTRLAAVVTAESARRLNLAVGSPVWISFGAFSVILNFG